MRTIGIKLNLRIRNQTKVREEILEETKRKPIPKIKLNIKTKTEDIPS
jgi:hypothetical protein